MAPARSIASTHQRRADPLVLAGRVDGDRAEAERFVALDVPAAEHDVARDRAVVVLRDEAQVGDVVP